LSNERKFEIDVEVIKTPAGNVPTAKTVERIIEGMNVLSEDLSSVSSSLSESLKHITTELKSIKKMMSKTTVSSEATMEAVKRLEKKINQFSKEEAERWRRLQQVLTLITEVLKVIHNEVNEKSIRTTSKIDKLLSLLAPTTPAKTVPAKLDKPAKPLKKVT